MTSPPVKPTINLLRGWPSYDLLPTTSILDAATESLKDPSIAVRGLSYGADWGFQPLREALAEWLTSFYHPAPTLKANPTATSPHTFSPPSKDGDSSATEIKPGRICITGGASQNVACLLAVFSDPLYTRNVWMVAPTYFMACRIFEDAGFAGRLRAVPEDDEGIDIGFLERALERERGQRESVGEHETVRMLTCFIS